MGETQPRRTVESLPPRSWAMLHFVAREVDRTGYAPTVREICAALSLGSTSVVVYHLDRLVAVGLLTRGNAIARGITITAAGYAALGRPDPAADAELGRALRQAARRDPRAAGVLAELEVA